ncbi:hypothetical protein ACCO45_010402 [Purpureocillium lilacinum]|uniref:Uncharacterized protein n=1 Tax=Purpureocillium lilacinum TaxID=33203 RepID=A0ACC4DGZ6_PURLI
MSDRLDLAPNPRCRVCRAIVRMIKTPLRRQFSQSISFTGDEDPVSWNCAFHEPLLHLSNPHDNGIISRGNLSLSKWKGQPVFRVKNTVLHLARRDNVPCHWGMGRILGHEWIDLDVIKGFIDNCAQNHGAICAKFPFGDAPNAIDAPRPAFLIDVDASCVVDAYDAATGEPFTMLSYVRGDQGDHISLTTRNLKELQQPGGLKALGTLELIPRTFRDAMSLAALLGIRYIWIDRLCVLQDDDAHRRSEMTKVTLLSVCAVFVIAECDGTNASHGIRGIREIPDAQPRSLHRSHQVEAGRAWRDGVTYTCQGDTFAETVLARRVLRFEMGTVQWRCRSWPTYCGDEEQDDHMWEDCAHRCDRARWHCQMDWPTVIEKEEEWDSEESDDDGLSDGGPPHWTTALAKPWPGVREYYSMLMDLTAQKSVKPSDMPTVLGGLAATFARCFEGRIFCGLPETFFDAALLWRIPARSVPSGIAPSWSWMGWGSPPNSQNPWGLWHAPEMYGVDHPAIKDTASVEIIPIVEWAVGDEANCAPDRRLPLQSSKWRLAREAFRDASTPLPPGWVRQRFHLDPLSRSSVPRGFATEMVCRLVGPEPSKSFWYPIPMVDTLGFSNADPGNPHGQFSSKIVNGPFHYLFGTVSISRGHFYVHGADWATGTGDVFVNIVTQEGRSHTGTHVLRNEAGRVAGVLEMYDVDQGSGENAASQSRVPLDLIAISRGVTRQTNQGYPECAARQKLSNFQDDSWYEFYNVVWVVWSQGGANVALRRGLGRIPVKVWDKSSTELEDIVFG